MTISNITTITKVITATIASSTTKPGTTADLKTTAIYRHEIRQAIHNAEIHIHKLSSTGSYNYSSGVANGAGDSWDGIDSCGGSSGVVEVASFMYFKDIKYHTSLCRPPSRTAPAYQYLRPP